MSRRTILKQLLSPALVEACGVEIRLRRCRVTDNVGIQPMDTLYELTADNVWLQEIDTEESPRASRSFGRGTQFRLFRQRHRRGPSKIEFYTIEIQGKHYNVVAQALENFMRQVDPPT